MIYPWYSHALQVSSIDFCGRIWAIKNLKAHIEEAQAGHGSFFVKLLEAAKTSKLVYKKPKHIQSEQAKKTQETGLKDIRYAFS